MKFRNLIWLVLGMVLIGFVDAATYDCNSCGDCDNKISLASAGDLVQLTTNIIDVYYRCINFDGKDYITFDCQGNYIGGDNDNLGYGIHLSDIGDGSNNNIVKNWNISLFAKGIWVSHSTNNTIINNTANYNYYEGIVLSISSSNRVINNTANYNTKNYHGIYLYESFNNIITGNTLNYHKLSGIYLYESFNNTFTDNIVSYNNDRGILLYESSNNTFTDNIVNNNNNDGIQFSSLTKNNSVFNNTLCFNSDTDVVDDYVNRGNLGDDNTCDSTYNWNDEGTTGCTYSCSAECDLPGDTPPCGVVTLSEVIDFINLWAQGQASLGDVVALINAWAG